MKQRKRKTKTGERKENWNRGKKGLEPGEKRETGTGGKKRTLEPGEKVWNRRKERATGTGGKRKLEHCREKNETRIGGKKED